MVKLEGEIDMIGEVSINTKEEEVLIHVTDTTGEEILIHVTDMIGEEDSIHIKEEVLISMAGEKVVMIIYASFVAEETPVDLNGMDLVVLSYTC